MNHSKADDLKEDSIVLSLDTDYRAYNNHDSIINIGFDIYC
jgi:hypothetical protein